MEEEPEKLSSFDRKFEIIKLNDKESGSLVLKNKKI